MGFLDKARKKAEIGPTDRVIETMQGVESAFLIRSAYQPCPEGELHYGIVIQDPANDTHLALVRCHPSWYMRMVDAKHAQVLLDGGLDESRALIVAMQNIGEFREVAPASTAPEAFGAWLISSITSD